MEDREILKRLAEIEGWEYAYTDDQHGPMFRNPAEKAFHGGVSITGFAWNPLTNWSDLGPLIEKHKVDTFWNPSDLDAIGYERGLYWEALICDYSGPNEMVRSSADNVSLPHAICLAIIEAHK